jgi:dynein heavy chain 1, cytosolic
MLVTQVFRQDRLQAAAQQFVLSVFGSTFMQSAEQELNLADIVENEIKSNTPILMCAAPGFDASARVEDLGAELNKQISSIAIGRFIVALIYKISWLMLDYLVDAFYFELFLSN